MNNLFLIGALGVGAYLLFREQIDAALSGETPAASSPQTTPAVPRISPTTGKVEYPTINLPTTPTLPTVTPTAPVNVPPPSWAVGQWYWVQGPNRTMAISASGGVTLLNNGRTSHGTFNNGVISIDGNDSPVTQNGAYLRTVNQTSGEVSDYSRTPLVATTPPVPTMTIPPPVVPSPYPQMPNPVPQVPTGGGYPTGGCLRYPCEPEIFI